MKKLLYATLASLSLVLIACPYEGKADLNTYEESLKLDKDIIDEWVAYNSEGGREELTIEKGGKTVLFVYHKQFEKNKLIGKFKYRAYSTSIGDKTIYNIENAEGNYLFASLEWTSKNEFNVEFIESDFVDKNFIPDSVNTENFRAFVTENIAKEELFSDKLEFYRKYSAEYEKVRMFMQKSGF
jgi:hypothetical protein